MVQGELILFILIWSQSMQIRTEVDSELLFREWNCSVIEMSSSGRWIILSQGIWRGEDARRFAVFDAEKNALRFVLHNEDVFPQLADISPTQWDCVYDPMHDGMMESITGLNTEVFSFEEKSGITIAKVKPSIDVYLLETLLGNECGVQPLSPPPIALVVEPESTVDTTLFYLKGKDWKGKKIYSTILSLLSRVRFDLYTVPFETQLHQYIDATNIEMNHGRSHPRIGDSFSRIGYRYETEVAPDDTTFKALVHLVVRESGTSKEILCSQSAKAYSPNSMVALETAVIKALFLLIGCLRKSVQPNAHRKFRVVVKFLNEVPTEWREEITEHIIDSLNSICDCKRSVRLYQELKSRFTKREHRVIMRRFF